ncbi:AIM24 family protein, partial [Streptomyces caelestis]
IRSLTGIGGTSGEEHQFEFVGAGTVLLQSSEALMAEQAAGVVPNEPGVPGGGGQPGSAPRMPGQLGDLQRRFGL